MTDGNGTTQYSYVAPFNPGALQLQSSPLPTSAIVYAYDELGRPVSRAVAGAGAETVSYDAIDRPTSHANDLGSFALSYLGQTGQITSRQLASSTLSTTWNYLPNSGDRRLAGIAPREYQALRKEAGDGNGPGNSETSFEAARRGKDETFEAAR